MTLLRQMPEGFAEQAKGLTTHIICKRWKCNRVVARRWRKEAGLYTPKPEHMLPMPEGFAEYARGKLVKELCAEYRRDRVVIQRWRAEAGLGKNTRVPVASVETLRDMAHRMTLKDIAAHFKVSPPTMRRAYQNAGVAYGKPAPTAKVVTRLALSSALHRPVLNATAQYAKDWLQRQEPIWRCREDGVYDFTGSHFRFRGRVWDAAALVKKAREMGWQSTTAASLLAA